MRITQTTRRDIADAITVEQINWAGRLEEQEFLARLFDLSSLPSTDVRFKNASGDIWQHRINNPTDWKDNWVFYDRRFNLMGCDDELFLRFLCETIHPVVRQDVVETEKLCQLYNSYLQHDGYQLVEKTRMSGKPVFAGRDVGVIGTPGIKAVKQVWNGTDASYVVQQITRMESSVLNDPELAIGTAKELIETCCKSILHERNAEIPNNADIPQLVKLTSKELQLTPADIHDAAKASETVKRLLSNLATITQGIAELRNQYGTGHGKIGTARGLTSRHAKLAVGAASTLAVFLIETHQVRS
jgi:hypothetical protein